MLRALGKFCQQRSVRIAKGEINREMPKEDRAQEIAEIVRDGMQGATKLNVPLTVDIGIGANWKEAKS